MDTAKIEAGVRLILEGVGEDPEREGLRETPARVARMYEEVLGGLEEDPSRHFDVTFDEGHEEIVLVGDIPFFSMCEHHLAPFFGKAHVAYIPGEDGRICGISKLARLVDGFAKRPQVQERLTAILRQEAEEEQIVVEGDGEGSILVVKDSYANSFIPYLTANYGKIGVVDFRNFKYGLDSTIEQEGYDEVLILYNFQTFIADSNLIYISRPSTLQ